MSTLSMAAFALCCTGLGSAAQTPMKVRAGLTDDAAQADYELWGAMNYDYDLCGSMTISMRSLMTSCSMTDYI